jgi:hypothetical protein
VPYNGATEAADGDGVGLTDAAVAGAVDAPPDRPKTMNAMAATINAAKPIMGYIGRDFAGPCESGVIFFAMRGRFVLTPITAWHMNS